MMNPVRIVFLGADAIALPLLNALVNGESGAEIVGVFTQPDRAVGRGQKILSGPVKLWAMGKNIPFFQPAKFDEAARLELAALKPDVGLVMAYGHILRDDVIATPPMGMLNLHTSILPKYRGASPIQTAVANAEKATGVTLMRIVRKLDAGPVADLEGVAISDLDTAADIENRLSSACIGLVLRNLESLCLGKLAFTEQDDANATYCRRLSREDGVLDFNSPASALAARINGLFPWPACQFEYEGTPIKCGLADSSAGSSGNMGEVLGQDTHGLLVSTADGILRIRRLQRPGGRLLDAAEFLRGFPIAVGTILPSVSMPSLVSTVPFPR